MIHFILQNGDISFCIKQLNITNSQKQFFQCFFVFIFNLSSILKVLFIFLAHCQAALLYSQTKSSHCRRHCKIQHTFMLQNTEQASCQVDFLFVGFQKFEVRWFDQFRPDRGIFLGQSEVLQVSVSHGLGVGSFEQFVGKRLVGQRDLAVAVLGEKRCDGFPKNFFLLSTEARLPALAQFGLLQLKFTKDLFSTRRPQTCSWSHFNSWPEKIQFNL